MIFGDLIFVLVMRFFNLSPKLDVVNGDVVATSPWKVALLTLGFTGKRVEVQPRARVIRIDRRYLWILHARHRIEFDWIEAITYRYVGGGEDTYRVGLRLKDGNEVGLFTFSGGSGFSNNSILPDWAYPLDRVTENLAQGSQQADSLTFVDVLARILGVPLDNSL